MTTYKTIKEAFQNGSGDVFYSKNNEYVAVSRHDNNSNLEANGFTFVSYLEVLEIAKSEKNEKTITVEIASVNNQKSKKFVNYDCGTSYYDEFPDAYGQHL